MVYYLHLVNVISYNCPKAIPLSGLNCILINFLQCKILTNKLANYFLTGLIEKCHFITTSALILIRQLMITCQVVQVSLTLSAFSFTSSSRSESSAKNKQICTLLLFQKGIFIIKIVCANRTGLQCLSSEDLLIRFRKCHRVCMVTK